MDHSIAKRINDHPIEMDVVNLNPETRERLDIHNSELPILCQACEARHKGICGVMTAEQLVRLSKHTTKHMIGAEQQIAFQGQTVARYSNILRGVVKLSKTTADGRQQIVGLQFAPDFMGRPFSKENDFAVEAATDVKICSFPRAILDEFISRAPDLEHRLHLQALRELDESREWMLTLGRKTAAERVASFLYFIAVHVDPEATSNERKFEIPLKRSDIADFLGLTIETVSRQITKLRQTGIVHITNNRTVEVPDLIRLRALIEVNSLD